MRNVKNIIDLLIDLGIVKHMIDLLIDLGIVKHMIDLLIFSSKIVSGTTATVHETPHGKCILDAGGILAFNQSII